jgi:polyisoprenoid-binding protein YceI
MVERRRNTSYYQAMLSRSLVPILLVACATAASAQDTEPRLHVVDAERSHIFAVTHRAGLLSFLGHEHASLATAFTSELCLAPSAPARASLRVTLPVSALAIDTDAARRVAGMGGGPGEETRREIAVKLLDEKRLNAQAHPLLTFETTSVRVGRDESMEVHGRLTIRGVTQDVVFPARIESGSAGGVRLHAQLRIRLSAFGIEPETVAMVVKVSNDVDLHIDLLAIATERPCEVGDSRSR